jgi:hypothetical protein
VTPLRIGSAWLRHGLPCAVVWVGYLLAFWPGVLTEDSIEQWTAMTTGVIGAYHSPLQTVLHGVLTRVWASPAIIVLAQIAALSAAYALVVAECAARGAPRWLLAATTGAMVVLPANGFLTITLWKDVPYAVSLLWVTGLTLRLARRGGHFAGPREIVVLAIALTLAATFRHNGLPTIALFVAVLIWAVPAPRRPAWTLAALTLAGVLGLQAGLFRAIGVQPYHPAFGDQTILHQVAAAMQTGTGFDQPDFAALTRLKPIDRWVRDYRCATVIPTLAGVLEHSPAADYAAQRPALRVAWWHALTRAPGTIARHHACVSAMLWNPFAEPYLVSTAIVANDHGLRTTPAVPALTRALNGLLEVTSRQPWRAVFWSPASDLLVVVGGLVWALRRRVDRVTLAALALPVLHTVVLFAAIPSAEYRLQYPLALATLITPLIVVAALRARADGAA